MTGFLFSMADIKDLQIKVTADTKGFKDISTEARKTAKSVDAISVGEFRKNFEFIGSKAVPI